MRKLRRFLAAAALPAAAICIFTARANLELIMRFMNKIPRCLFNSVTGGLCPACGNTRSVMLLLKGDVIGSLRHNITPIVLGIILFLLYVEFAFGAFGKKIKILPRKGVFWYSVLGFMFVYYIVRNFISFQIK